MNYSSPRMQKRYRYKLQTGMVAFFPILVLGVLTISIIMLSSYLSREGVSFDIRERAVYYDDCISLGWWSPLNRITAMGKTCTVDYNINPYSRSCSVWVVWCAESSYSNVKAKLASGEDVGSGNTGATGWEIPVGEYRIIYLYSNSSVIGNVRVNATSVGTPSEVTGTLSVSPTKCIPPSGSNSCTVYVTWNITGSSNPKITYTRPNSETVVWSYAAAGNNNPFVLRRNLPNRFSATFAIYDGDNWIKDVTAYIP